MVWLWCGVAYGLRCGLCLAVCLLASWWVNHAHALAGGAVNKNDIDPAHVCHVGDCVKTWPTTSPARHGDIRPGLTERRAHLLTSERRMIDQRTYNLVYLHKQPQSTMIRQPTVYARACVRATSALP